MRTNNKTIKNISVTWEDKHDVEMQNVLRPDDVYVSEWFSLANPPQGSPKTGFNIRSQSKLESGFLYIDFDNIPYFYRHDVNPHALLWEEQLPIVLEALQATGVDMDNDCNNALVKYPKSLEILQF